mmetsp:Transcript_7554/g.12697  ORF Transcript_7554/g.12697 Transcript_7554/m.12697 type:complete len:793 (+) Transcript_7554:89-2467(+)|eukprot:CAMPEP_0114467344 /NCGR_PEP_ID=MMETSP0104-20121206/9569_1 /TAXON_ID=37642 ORGANISM="Paraphysomonas imperforata, Strain PA2" /NCGR_SAMPLE_ID=MMETSP0104 /ASSEMBLY_ACC=CAM_ASM_000202 /LENGTH=792 /DNA_ID=CAMNT_0001640797 /DNA_START=40 /DNA_END=2418 /DNA_ORIENTATION=+
MASDFSFTPCADDSENLKVLLVASLFNCAVVKSADSGTVYPCATFGGKTVFGSNNICRLFYAKSGACNVGLLDDVLDLEEFAVCSFTRLKPKKKIPPAILSDLKANLEQLSLALSLINSSGERRMYEFACLLVYPSLSRVESISKESIPDSLTAVMQICREHSCFSKAEAALKDMQPSCVVAPSSLGPLPQVKIDILTDGLVNSLRILFSAAILHALPMATRLSDTASDHAEAVITRCGNAKFGDFQCNNAMKLSKLLKSNAEYTGSSAPKDIANAIVASLPVNSVVSEASVMPNGFINIRVASGILISTLAGIVSHGVRPPLLEKKRVLVDFSSPNIAKEMHVGHLRSTIIGDALCRMLEFCGHDVLRVNHVGDWGTQFGMLISYLQEAFPDILTTPPNITDLTKIYKAAKERFDKDEEFKTLSRNNVVKLQAGDAACTAIWNLLCDISRKEFQRVYDALDVKLTEVGESYYNEMIPPVLEELTSIGLTETEDKLLLSRLPHFDIPLILRKSDGGYGYDSTDMAAINYRLKTLNRDWLIYITDAGQMGHFHKVFDVAKSAGWANAEQRLDFIGFGVVCGEDGKRFKTRSGDTVRLIDLLDAAKDRMSQSLRQRKEEGKTGLSDEEIVSAASSIGYGAVKYFDLKQNPITNYIFNYDRMLDTKGDTAVYLLFAYARVASILRKGVDEKGFDAHSLSIEELESTISLDDAAERALAFELLQFGEVLRSTLNDLMPNKLCEYLKEVSVKLTDFVTKCHVLNSKETSSRLILCEATRLVLSKLFTLLGIETLEQI